MIFLKVIFRQTPSGYEYDYLLEIGANTGDEKTWLFDRLGLNNTVNFDFLNRSKTHRPQEEETKRKFYGQLSKREIR